MIGAFLWYWGNTLRVIFLGEPKIETENSWWGSAHPLKTTGSYTKVYESGKIIATTETDYEIFGLRINRVDKFKECPPVNPRRVERVIEELTLEKYMYNAELGLGSLEFPERGFAAIGTSHYVRIKILLPSGEKKWINSSGFGSYFDEITSWCSFGD